MTLLVCCCWIAGAALLLVAAIAGPERPRREAAALLAGLALFLLPITPAETNFDSAVRQAKAFLGGHAGLPERITWLEMFAHGDGFYFAYPPAVSAVVAPWVLVTGGRGGQPLFNTLLILASALLLHLLARHLEGLRRWTVLLPVAYALGTPVLYSAATGTVWLLMHGEANALLLLALWCSFVRGAHGWAGLFLSLGAQCRYVVALAGVAFLVRMVTEAPPARRWSSAAASVARFAAAGVLAALPTLGYSWIVFGDPFLSPYTLGWLEWGHGHLEPNFELQHVLPNLRFYFTAMPEILPSFPWFHFGEGGQSTWLMSPFLFGAWIAPWRYRFVRAFVAGAAAMGGFYLLYRFQGVAQYGARYMQDLLPLLVPLAGAGFSRPGNAWARAFAVLVGISIAINVCGLAIVRFLPA